MAPKYKRKSHLVVAGHRGYKAKFTENTLYGFTKCYDSGATGIETDVFLTKDNEVVISHDVNTKRMFVEPDGTPADHNILQSNYDELKDLRTKTGEKLLRFRDVLEWFVAFIETTGDYNKYKIMLDIKRLNPPKILRYLWWSILEVKGDVNWWLPHIQLGVWDLSMVKYLNQHQFFQKAFHDAESQVNLFHISVAWKDSLHYIAYNEYLEQQPDDRIKLKVTGISILYLLTWNTEFLLKFAPLLRKCNMGLYSWTINAREQVQYVLGLQKAYNFPEIGVISDDPGKMVGFVSEEAALESIDDSTSLLRDEKSTHYKVKISLWQKAVSGLFLLFIRLAGAKRITDDDLAFDKPVDENHVRAVKLSKMGIWIFQTCQRFGIF
jgi:phosphatidylglycerol phospholipase C